MPDSLTPADQLFVATCFADAANLTDLRMGELVDMTPEMVLERSHDVAAQMREIQLRLEAGYD